MDNAVKAKILVVEDESAVADTILYALRTECFEPVWASTAVDARALLDHEQPALVVMDVGLPDGNGFELCKEIRKESDVPIIFLTARAEEIDRVVGLEIGGDDYVIKPFSPRELTARIRAVLRRHQLEPPEGIMGPTAPPTSGNSSQSPAANFQVDEERCLIRYFGQALALSRYEFRILQTLVRHPGRVFQREYLMNTVWDDPEMSMERTVDTHIKTIRAKLRAIRPDQDPIVTVRGFGYSLKDKS